jgi:hypothetical protein
VVSADGNLVEARGVSTPAFAAEPETGPKTGPKTSTEIALAGTTVELRSSGAMFWPERSLLCVGDLHLGRAERLAREGGDLLPSYESATCCRHTNPSPRWTGSRPRSPR